MNVLQQDSNAVSQLTSLSLRGQFVRREEDQRALRSRSLDELADALDEAARVLATLDLGEEQISTALDLHARILAARVETNSLKLSGTGRDRQLAESERAAILWQGCERPLVGRVRW